MQTLNFGDRLILNRFTRNNEYLYMDKESLNVYYLEEDKEIPFLLYPKGNELYHPKGEIHFSTNRQLGGRTLTTNKIKEVMDTARCPLSIKLGAKTYLIGKGFLADFTNRNDIQVLFLATVPRGVNITDITQVKFYISRNVYLTTYRKIQPAVKELMAAHKGDIMLTSSIEKSVGHSINMPTFTSIKEKKEYNDSLIDYCIGEMRKKVPQKKSTIKTAEQKKAKESEILDKIKEINTEAGSFEGLMDSIEKELQGVQDRVSTEMSVPF